MHFKKKSVLIAILTVLVVVFNCFPVTATAQSGISELQQESAKLKQQAKEIQKNIDALKKDASKQEQLKAQLQRQISNTQEQISVYSNEIASLNGSIDKLNEDIASKEAELQATKDLFKQRLRAMYVSGSSNELLMLLGSNDVADYLSKTELTRSVSEHDNQIMDQIVRKMQEITDAQKQLMDEKASKQSVQATLAEKQNELETQIADANSALAKINSEVTSAEKAKTSYVDSDNEVQEKIEALLKEELKKAQEAERQAELKRQQEAAAGGSSGSGSSSSGDPTSSLGFIWPTPGFTYISSPFGYRTHPISGIQKLHTGIDIAGSGINGTPIRAAESGTVSIATFNDGGYGYYVLLYHGTKSDGKQYATLYGHMTKYTVSVGQYVNKGDVIGYVGSTGASTGPHLHFEVRVNGTPVNPLLYY